MKYDGLSVNYEYRLFRRKAAMSVKCKVFTHNMSRVHYLEQEINDFIKETGALIINSTQSCDATGDLCVIVWYDEGKNSQKPQE